MASPPTKLRRSWPATQPRPLGRRRAGSSSSAAKHDANASKGLPFLKLGWCTGERDWDVCTKPEHAPHGLEQYTVQRSCLTTGNCTRRAAGAMSDWRAWRRPAPLAI
eukprot:7380089-Prymnesium_polylepis.1